MSIAAFRLERFDRDEVNAPPHPQLTAAVEDAYQRGYRQGQIDAETRQMGALTTALLICAEKLADEHMIRASARDDVARSMGRLLDALIDKIGPIGQREQFRAFLTDQLEDLSSQAAQSHCLIRCAAELAPDVSQVLQQLKLTGIRVEVLKDPDALAEVELAGGLAIFDPAKVIDSIRSLSQNLVLETQA